MSQDWERTLAFVAQGTALCDGIIERLDGDGFDAPSSLPGWQRRHLIAHLAANADAIGRLTTWARTGVRTPMYASPEQRAADIERGASLGVEELGEWFRESSEELAQAFASLDDAALAREVVTAQGRTVPATETAWMRAREVLVHAVDLDAGVGFGDLPDDFLRRLRADILVKRRHEILPEVHGELPDVVRWLAGRGAEGVRLADDSAAPMLGPWL